MLILLPSLVLKAIHRPLVWLRWERAENDVLEELHSRGWYWSDQGFWRPRESALAKASQALGAIVRLTTWLILALALIAAFAYLYLGLEP